MLKKSLLAMVFVGTVLVTLNQGDALAEGRFSRALYWKIPLTYLVPFCVATWGALTNAYDRVGVNEVPAQQQDGDGIWEVDDQTIVVLDDTTGDIVIASPSSSTVLPSNRALVQL